MLYKLTLILRVLQHDTGPSEQVVDPYKLAVSITVGW
jgi:hypothetical protein